MASSLCVFCGSHLGTRPEYSDAARELGRLLARRDITLVYGGGSVGLMGVVADAVLEADGRVIGVIPKSMARVEVMHEGCTELHIVADMHERKAKMAQAADAFLALPGGYGTYEELFEVVTWRQLGYHHKNIGVLDVGNYFRPLHGLIEQAVNQGFVRAELGRLIQIAETPEQALSQLLHA